MPLIGLRRLGWLAVIPMPLLLAIPLESSARSTRGVRGAKLQRRPARRIVLYTNRQRGIVVHTRGIWSSKHNRALRRWRPIRAAEQPEALKQTALHGTRLVVVQDGHGTLSIWRLTDGRLLRRHRCGRSKRPPDLDPERLCYGQMQHHPKGRLLAVHYGTAIRVLDLRTGRLVKTIGDPDRQDVCCATVSSARFDPHGRYLILAKGCDGEVEIWSVPGFRRRHLLKLGCGGCNEVTIQFLAQGRQIKASCVTKRRWRRKPSRWAIWQVSTGRLLRSR